VVIRKKFKDFHFCADVVNLFIRLFKLKNNMHILPIGAIVGPAHLARGNDTAGGINCIWLVNNHVDLDTYWAVYYAD
jgi:hypothetical protein